MTALKAGQRYTATGYAHALAVIVAGGATWHTVAAAMQTGRMTAQIICRAFHRAGLTHIAGWHIPDGNVRARAPIYAFGEGVDVEWPGGGRKQTRNRSPIELLTFCNTIKALMSDTFCGKSLSAEVGSGNHRALKTLAALKRHRLIYIAEYEVRSNGGAGFPLYAWGPGKKDRQKPTPLSQKDINKRHNDIRGHRRATFKLMHGLATGKSLDGRVTRFQQPEMAEA